MNQNITPEPMESKPLYLVPITHEDFYGNPEMLLPVQRKDDRRLPGIIIGWATDYSTEYFKWRVWDGTIQREDRHDKDAIYGYFDYHGLESAEGSSASLIIYPKDKPESEFVDWANTETDRFMDEFEKTFGMIEESQTP